MIQVRPSSNRITIMKVTTDDIGRTVYDGITVYRHVRGFGYSRFYNVRKSGCKFDIATMICPVDSIVATKFIHSVNATEAFTAWCSSPPNGIRTKRISSDIAIVRMPDPKWLTQFNEFMAIQEEYDGHE